MCILDCNFSCCCVHSLVVSLTCCHYLVIRRFDVQGDGSHSWLSVGISMSSLRLKSRASGVSVMGHLLNDPVEPVNPSAYIFSKFNQEVSKFLRLPYDTARV